MKIIRIIANNFRSYKDLTLVFGQNPTIFVGENNSGKSSLITALNFARLSATGARAERNDWTNDDISKRLSLAIDVVLDDDDLIPFASDTRLSILDFKRNYGNILVIRMAWSAPNSPAATVLSFAKETRGDIRVTALVDATQSFIQSRDAPPKFGKMIFERLGKLLEERLVLFPEYRVRPQRASSDALSSPDGRDVASVLVNLRLSTNKEQRDRFRRIEAVFSSLFPGLSFDVMKENIRGQNEETVERDVIAIRRGQAGAGSLPETPLEGIGSGIADMLVLLTHIVESEGNVIAIDEPELHLHPHTQRLLSKVLQESSTKNQVILMTHSSQFVDLRDPSQVVLIRYKDGLSLPTQVPTARFSNDEKVRLAKFSSDDKDFLFSRKVLMVEGDTEIGAMPIFARKLGKDFDINGTSLISFDGSYFGLSLKLVHAYDFPYVVMCDKDALMDVQEKIELDGKDLKTCRVFHELRRAEVLTNVHAQAISKFEKEVRASTSEDGKKKSTYDDKIFEALRSIAAEYFVHVLSGDFEDVMKAAGLGGIMDEARTRYGKSKVLQGRFVAENAKKTPPELEKVINQIIAK